MIQSRLYYMELGSKMTKSNMRCWLMLAFTLAAPSSVTAQKTAIHTVTPQDVALISHNVSAPINNNAPFQLYDPSFSQILGQNASLTLILRDSRPLFHEAGLYIDGNNPSIYATSNQFPSDSPSPETNNKTIVITRIDRNAKTGKWTKKVIHPSPPVLLPNGGFFHDNSIIFTAQGDRKQPGGLIQMHIPASTKPGQEIYPTRKLLNNYLGLPFNSLNDVFVTRDGKAWFTDPSYGFLQDIRPRPQLPDQVYVYVPGSTEIRPVEAGISHPNGITFSPDEKTAYITDGTGSYEGDPRPRLIYAYDVVDGFLTGKRVFAQPAAGIADGIKADSKGNVYAGCGDGVNVWNPAGRLLGKITVDGGSANFAFGPNGMIFVFNEEKLFLAQLSSHVQPAVVNRLKS